MVEIKVGVVDARVSHRIESLFVRLFNRFFVAGLIDKIDEVLIAVERDLLAKVTRQRFRLRIISVVSEHDSERGGRDKQLR